MNRLGEAGSGALEFATTTCFVASLLLAACDPSVPTGEESLGSRAPRATVIAESQGPDDHLSLRELFRLRSEESGAHALGREGEGPGEVRWIRS